MEYTDNGYLPKGCHAMVASDFIDEFCHHSNRAPYEGAIINIFDFARSKGATRIIIGGSFITNDDDPSDLDCMIVFHDERSIPSYVDCAQVGNLEYDILYGSEQEPRTIDTFIKLMSTDRYGREDRGYVEVLLCDEMSPWEVHYVPNEDDFKIISRVYSERNIIERNKRRGLLVVIPGVRTRAEWLSNLIPAANHQGWQVAPFIYDNPATLLFDNDHRKRIVEDFRGWIYDLEAKYQPLSISLICHSFGTYIITKYIDGFKSVSDFLPIEIESLILTGSIINPDYDWNMHMPHKVGRILNIVAGNDDAVKYMPKSDMKKLIGMDPLFGRGAIDGIHCQSERILNRKFDILTHTNIFKDDIIEKVFLPFLNANNGIGHKETCQTDLFR